jgi:hypothetical protein
VSVKCKEMQELPRITDCIARRPWWITSYRSRYVSEPRLWAEGHCRVAGEKPSRARITNHLPQHVISEKSDQKYIHSAGSLEDEVRVNLMILIL